MIIELISGLTPSQLYLTILVLAAIVAFVPLLKFRIDAIFMDNYNLSAVMIFLGSLYYSYTVVDPSTGLQNILANLAGSVGVYVFLVPIIKEVYIE